MGEKVDLMNEENREQTGGKRRVYGEQGAHSGCIIGTRTHRYHFPHSSGAAATLASLDMQSGPISSSVCRKWHVPPEEAQKQRQCPQPAINHAFVSHCVCSFGHTWIMGSLVINSPPKKLIWNYMEWNLFSSLGKYQSLHPLYCFLTNILLWNWLKTQDKQLQWGACCFWFKPFRGVRLFPASGIPRSTPAPSNPTAGLVFYSMGHFICRSSRTEGSKCICNEWKYNCTLDLDQYIGFILTPRSHWVEITTDLCQ